MSTENKETKILLSPENYALWLLPMKAKLHKNKSLQVVNGSVACPDPEKDKENFRLYAKLNEDAYIEIIQHLNQEVLAYVSTTLVEADEFNGLKLWQLLKSKYAGNDLTSKTTALKKFLAVDFSSLPSFLPVIRSANHRLVVSGISLDDQVKTILMLDKLPKSFESFKTNISMNFESEPFENVLPLQFRFKVSSLIKAASHAFTVRSLAINPPIAGLNTLKKLPKPRPLT